MTHPLTPREKVFVGASCDGERCHCGAPAVRKVGEEISYDDPNPRRHNLTAYVCARHFSEMMGPAGARSVGYTALASGSGDYAALARAIERLLPIGIHETPDYAEVSFGECQAQAMTMEPETWLALNQLPALLAENAALRAQHEADMAEVALAGQNLQSQRLALTEAERKLAEAAGLNDRAADLMRLCTETDRIAGVSSLNVYTNMKMWLADQSRLRAQNNRPA